MSVEIYEDRPVILMLPPRPVINGHTPDRFLLGWSRSSIANYLPSNRVVTDRNREAPQQPFAGQSARDVPDRAHHNGQPLGPPRIDLRHTGNSLTEYPPRTFLLLTPILVNTEPKLNRTALPRQVGEPSGIPTMPRRRLVCANWAQR